MYAARRKPCPGANKETASRIGITDGTFWEITDGLKEGQEFASGSYKAVNKELEDGKKIRKGTPDNSEGKEKK